MAGVQRTGPVPIEIANQDTRERRAPQPRLVAADEEEPTLASYLETVNQARWLILVATLLAVTGAGLYVFFATPIYQSDTLVQLEEKKGTLSGLDDLSNMFSSPSPAETEIEILRSRTLVGSVVDELHLYVLAEPRYFPMVGKGIARRRASDGPASPVLDLASFAWGGERIAVDRIEVPRRWEGKRLTLVARGAGRYELLDPNGSLIASGEAGKALAAGELGLFVSDLVAREGTQFWVARLPRTQVIEELQGDLVIAEKGKKTGILRVGLEAPAPERLAAVLDAIARTYLRQNVERKSAEAEKTLRFINGQLPQLRQSVDVAEQALSTYRAMNGSVDVSLETKGALDRAVDVEKELTGLELQVSEAKLRFTDSHPAMITARAKIARLSVERDEINARIKRLPAAELQSARLIRDMKVANELYVLLLNKAQELQVVKSGTIGNVRILDAALVPEAPVSPRSAATLALAALAGAVLGAIAAFGRKALDQGVDDPELIERESGLPVYATVPHSAEQADLSRGLGKKGSADSAVLAVVQPNALAIEALRSLRTSLQFALAEARNNIVAISGPSPGIGKSFVCVNLAHVQADNGRRCPGSPTSSAARLPRRTRSGRPPRTCTSLPWVTARPIPPSCSRRSTSRSSWPGRRANTIWCSSTPRPSWR